MSGPTAAKTPIGLRLLSVPAHKSSSVVAVPAIIPTKARTLLHLEEAALLARAWVPWVAQAWAVAAQDRLVSVAVSVKATAIAVSVAAIEAHSTC